jgi:hypothetical protein
MRSIDKRRYLIYEAPNYVIKQPKLILIKSREFDPGGAVIVLAALKINLGCHRFTDYREVESVVTRELIAQDTG